MKTFRPLLVLLLIIVVSGLVPTVSVFAETKLPSVESSQTPDIKRSGPIKTTGSQSVQAPVAAPQVAATGPEVQITTLGPNLITNPSVESAATPSLPAGWARGGYGANTRVLTYPAVGLNGSQGLKVSITAYSGGDAKWYFADVPVTPGKSYRFSDYYLSDVSSILTVRYTMSNGSLVYSDLATLPAQSTFTQKVVEFTPPAGAVSATIFHLLKQAGNLTTDEFSLSEVTVAPPDQTNFISNPNLEQVGTGGRPVDWFKGGYGANTRALSYPVAGVSGSNGAKVEITSYTSGDAKWYFAPLSLEPGTYTYSDQYISNISSHLTAQFQNSNGTYSYQDLGTFPASGSFATASADFTVPSGVSNVTIFHLIKGVGFLTIDNAALRLKSSGGGNGIFDTGAVTLRFDDNWLSQHQNAIPKLNSAGFAGTFFVVTQQISDNGYVGFMSKSQIVSLAGQGHEIAAHTRTHRALTSLSVADQQSEIQGSRQDLLSWGVGPVSTFAYPFGDYDATTISVVRDAGFEAAGSTIDGYVSPNSDRYQLERQSVEVGTTVAQVKQWIDTAIANKRWLILTFHSVDTSGNQYSVTPSNFNQIIDYLKQKQVPVVTVSQGLQSLP